MLSQSNMVRLSSVLQTSRLLQGLQVNLITHPHPQFSMAILECLLQDMMANTILRSNTLQSNRFLRRVPRGENKRLIFYYLCVSVFCFPTTRKSAISERFGRVSKKSAKKFTLRVKLLSMLLNLFRE